MNHRANKKSENIYYGLTKGIAMGVICILVAFWFWLDLVGNPFEELALIRSAQTVSGFIVDTWEEPLDTDYGETRWVHGTIYKYYIDGREFIKSTRDSSGRLREEFVDLAEPYPVEVEYIPKNPEVSRIKGNGCQSIKEWLWRTVGLGGILLIAFLSIGFIVIRSSINDYRCKKSRFEKENESVKLKDLTENHLRKKTAN